MSRLEIEVISARYQVGRGLRTSSTSSPGLLLSVLPLETRPPRLAAAAQNRPLGAAEVALSHAPDSARDLEAVAFEGLVELGKEARDEKGGRRGKV